MEEPAGVERVRDEPELESSLAQRLQQRRRMRRRLAGGVPGRVLGLEEPRQFVVRDLDAEVVEQPPHETRILELLDGSGNPEKRLVAFAKMSRHPPDLGEVVTLKSGEGGPPGRVPPTPPPETRGPTGSP